MKLLKIKQFSFYGEQVESQKYIAVHELKVKEYLLIYLSCTFGFGKPKNNYHQVIESFVDNDCYFFGKIESGLGDVCIEQIGDIEIFNSLLQEQEQEGIRLSKEQSCLIGDTLQDAIRYTEREHDFLTKTQQRPAAVIYLEKDLIPSLKKVVQIIKDAYFKFS